MILVVEAGHSGCVVASAASVIVGEHPAAVVSCLNADPDKVRVIKLAHGGSEAHLVLTPPLGCGRVVGSGLWWLLAPGHRARKPARRAHDTCWFSLHLFNAQRLRVWLLIICVFYLLRGDLSRGLM